MNFPFGTPEFCIPYDQGTTEFDNWFAITSTVTIIEKYSCLCKAESKTSNRLIALNFGKKDGTSDRVQLKYLYFIYKDIDYLSMKNASSSLFGQTPKKDKYYYDYRLENVLIDDAKLDQNLRNLINYFKGEGSSESEVISQSFPTPEKFRTSVNTHSPSKKAKAPTPSPSPKTKPSTVVSPPRGNRKQAVSSNIKKLQDYTDLSREEIQYKEDDELLNMDINSLKKSLLSSDTDQLAEKMHATLLSHDDCAILLRESSLNNIKILDTSFKQESKKQTSKQAPQPQAPTPPPPQPQKPQNTKKASSTPSTKVKETPNTETPKVVPNAAPLRVNLDNRILLSLFEQKVVSVNFKKITNPESIKVESLTERERDLIYMIYVSFFTREPEKLENATLLYTAPKQLGFGLDYYLVQCGNTYTNDIWIRVHEVVDSSMHPKMSMNFYNPLGNGKMEPFEKLCQSIYASNPKKYGSFTPTNSTAALEEKDLSIVLSYFKYLFC